MQFCWLCGADYVNINRIGNTAHAEDCRYHTGNIRDPHIYHPDAYLRYAGGFARARLGEPPAAVAEGVHAPPAGIADMVRGFLGYGGPYQAPNGP
jgi:hypothetical protein